MAHHKSAIKRAKQNEKRRMRNRAQRSRMKTAIKKVEEAIAGSSSEEALARLKEAISIIDRTASKGVIHKNKAARLVSRLTRKVNNLLATRDAA